LLYCDANTVAIENAAAVWPDGKASKEEMDLKTGMSWSYCANGPHHLPPGILL
jgi:hypothetical protein